MAISNFAILSAEDWARLAPNFTQIAPVIGPVVGTSDPNLNVVFFVNNSMNTSFVIKLWSTGPESLILSNDLTVADQMDLTCNAGAGGQGYIYYSFTESQGWTTSFNVTLDITNTNSSKGKMTFTKGKGERPHF